MESSRKEVEPGLNPPSVLYVVSYFCTYISSRGKIIFVSRLTRIFCLKRIKNNSKFQEIQQLENFVFNVLFGR